MEKQFKTIDEQIDILQDKGLIIEDIDFAKETLLRENYFFIMGYRYLLVNSNNDKIFVKGSTFRELYSIFCFDRYFRNIIFKNVLVIENQLKSIISYQLSKKYGYKEKDYLNSKNFTNDYNKSRRVKDIINKMKRQIKVNAYQHNATMHYIDKYGYIPLWVLVKVLSFGLVCELYTILKDDDKDEIARIFNTNKDDLEDFLVILSNYRNLCAHEDIVYDNKTERIIPNTRYHSLLNIPKTDGEYIYGKRDIFAVVIIFKSLLRKNEFNHMIKEIDYEIQKLDGRIDSIPVGKILDRMGFPDNYMDIIDL